MGTRDLINGFFNMAVYVPRKVFKEGRLVIQHEWNISPVEIPGIGTVEGLLDYVTSHAEGKKDEYLAPDGFY